MPNNILTLSGSTTLLHVNKHSVAGTLTTAGTALVLQVELNSNAGAATFSGSVTFQMGHGVITGGTLTTAGRLIKAPAKDTGIGGTLTTASSLIRQPDKHVDAEFVPAGELTPLHLFNIIAEGVLTLAGTMSRTLAQLLAGTLTLAGSLVRTVGQYIAGTLTTSGLLRQGIGEAPCVYTAGELSQRIYERIDDDGTYYSLEEVFKAMNAAQNLWALLTLCNEKVQGFTLDAATTFYSLRIFLTDYIVPLRVEITATGERLRPITLHQLDARYGAAWRSTPGTPTHYVAAGYDLFAVYPQPAAPTVITVTYAASPVQVTNLNNLFNDIPPEQQIHLVDFAIWWLRLKEGGEELQTVAQYLQRFIEVADKYGQFVRRRSYGQRYDTVPFDLASFDRGELEIELTAAVKRPAA